MCIDYHALNKITIKNNYHMPCIDNLLDWLNGGKYSCRINVKFHYNQIRIVDENVQKIAMRTKYGLYEFLVMPFGLGNAPSTFTSLMNSIFHKKLDEFMIMMIFWCIPRLLKSMWNIQKMFWVTFNKINSLPIGWKMNFPKRKQTS